MEKQRKTNFSTLSVIRPIIKAQHQIIKNGMSWFGLAISRRTSVRVFFSSPFSSKVVVYAHCLVTLSLSINETLKWLSLLPNMIS